MATARVRIIRRFCKGCELCVTYCRNGVIAMPEKVDAGGVRVPQVVNPDACKGCMRCVLMCPDAAIEIEEVPAEKAKA